MESNVDAREKSLPNESEYLTIVLGCSERDFRSAVKRDCKQHRECSSWSVASSVVRYVGLLYRNNGSANPLSLVATSKMGDCIMGRLRCPKVSKREEVLG